MDSHKLKQVQIQVVTPQGAFSTNDTPMDSSVTEESIAQGITKLVEQGLSMTLVGGNSICIVPNTLLKQSLIICAFTHEEKSDDSKEEEES